MDGNNQNQAAVAAEPTIATTPPPPKRRRARKEGEATAARRSYATDFKDAEAKIELAIRLLHMAKKATASDTKEELLSMALTELERSK